MADNTFYEGGDSASGNAESSPKTIASGEPTQVLPVTESKEDEVITSTKLKQVLAELESKFQKNQDRVVSLIDKRVAAAKQETERAIEKLKSAGINITAEQERKLSDAALLEALKETSQPEPGTKASGNQEVGDVISRLVNSEAQNILKELDVQLTPAETRQLIPNANELSPFQFLQKFKEVAQAKKNNQQTAPNRIPTLATTGGSPPSEDILRQQYQDEIAKIMAGTHPTIMRGQNEKITLMKSEYAKKGLKGIY